MRAIVWMLLVGGCATSNAVNTCPVGTKLGGTRSAEGRVEWCTSTARPLDVLPAGRTSESAMMLLPTALPAGVDGPFSTWYANGAIASHGTYVDTGARSIPDGTWTFWYPSGQRRSHGAYRRGEPVGCFAMWDEQGVQITGTGDGGELRPTTCEPPDDEAARILEGSASARITPAWADASVQAFVGDGGIGARNAMQVFADPRLSTAIAVTGRLHVGAFRLGPTAALRLSGDRARAFSAGIAAAILLPSPHPRLELEAGAELGARYTAVKPFKPTGSVLGSALGSENQTFWSPLPAVQLTADIVISPTIRAFVSARVDGLPMRDVERDTRYCITTCGPPETETWQVGGITWGGTLGMRLVLR